MKKVKPFFLALLVYLPTIVLVPQAVVYTIISAIGLYYFLYDIRNKGITSFDVRALFFLTISCIIFFIGKPYALVDGSKSINDFIPYTFFILTTISFSRRLNSDIIKIILYLIVFETLTGIIQYAIGVPFFIKPNSVGMQEFGESDYLYYNKVYGLSSVTSIFSMKIFLGFILVRYLQFKKTTSYILYTLLGLGLIATFNRTAMAASAFFVLLLFLKDFKKGNFAAKFFISIAIIIFAFVVYDKFDVIENQFFRGKEMDMSGRDKIFPYYVDFISDNFFFGNFFVKHWVELTPGRIFHAHNSYLQTFANMGVIMGLIAILFFIFKINKRNYIFVIPILVYSSFQYGILWGVSFIDIIFFYFLFNINFIKKYSSKKHLQ